MDLLQVPEKQPDYRGNREHVDFLCRLSDYWTSTDELVTSISHQLEQVGFLVRDVGQ